MDHFEKLVVDCDAYIRAGADQHALRALSNLDLSQIPRKWRLPLAAICRRVAQISLGLRILSPIVGSKEAANPSSAELAEYGALLQKLGAIDDAIRFLAKVDAREVPEALMYRAVCHFSRWEYPAAVPLLENYIKTAGSDYQMLVGRVNLAAALVGSLQLDQAESLLQDIIQIANLKTFSRLEGNSYELLTQVNFLKGDLSAAARSLLKAERLIVSPKSLDYLYTKKCRAILSAFESGSVTSLVEFRNEASVWPHAETVREIDLYSLMIDYNEEVHRILYFGTPFDFYRSRMRSLIKRDPVGDHVLFGQRGSRSIDIVTGAGLEGTTFKLGSSVQKVLMALLSDLYRPARMGTLFSQLFPGEHFDIYSSPARIHQCLRRTRKWLIENRIPVEILENNGNYSLQIIGEISFRLVAQRELGERDDLLFKKLASMYSQEATFTSKEAKLVLGLTTTSLHRFIRKMLELGHIQKFGASTSTSYFIPLSRESHF